MPISDFITFINLFL